jgi:Pyridoxamine 5'-phosphate oxidase
MHWSDIEEAQPRLAALSQERLVGPGVVLVGTIRRDGTPRISPVEPYLLDGDLWLSMLWQSTKARDLLRDPRVLVHSIITGRDGAEGEAKLRGTARAEDDPRCSAVTPPRSRLTWAGTRSRAGSTCSRWTSAR